MLPNIFETRQKKIIWQTLDDNNLDWVKIWRVSENFFHYCTTIPVPLLCMNIYIVVIMMQCYISFLLSQGPVSFKAVKIKQCF